MKKALLFLGVAASALALASCDNGSKPAPDAGGNESTGGNGGSQTQEEAKGKVIELTYSGTASDMEFNQGLFENWKAKRAAEGDKNTYEIDYVDHGPDKVDSEIIDFSDDTAPDVFEFASDKISNLYKMGALSQLDGKYSDFIDNELSELGRDTATFNGGYYGYTFTGDNTYYFQYDKRIFTDEDVKSIEGILAKAKAQDVKVGYNLETAFWSAGALFTFGADYNVVFDDDGIISKIDATFDSEAGIKAIKAIKMIIEHESWQNAMEAPSESNKIGGCIEGTWNIAAYKKALGENYGCAPMPTVTIDGETKHLGAFVGGKLLGVNPQKSQNNMDKFLAAHDLAMYLAGEECQKARYTYANVGPCHKAVLELEEVKKDPNMVTLAQQHTFGHAQGAVPGGIWDAPAKLVAGLKDGTYTNDNLQEAATIVNTAIKKSK